MDNTGHRGAPAVVDIGHCPCNGSGGRDSSENRSDDIGDAEGDEFGVGIVPCADHTVSHSGREQGFDGSECRDGDGYREEVLHRLPVQGRHLRFRKACADGESVPDGVDAAHSGKCLQQVNRHSDNDDGHERPRNLSGKSRHHCNDEDADKGHSGIPPVDGCDMLEIEDPFAYEVTRNALASERKSQSIRNLRGENRQCDTAREAYHHRIGNELDDGPELEDAQQYQHYSGQHGGDGQSAESVGLDHAVNYDDEGSCRASDLDLASAQERYYETCNDGCDNAFFRGDAGCDGEGDGQRKGNDANDEAGHQVRGKCLLVVFLDTIEEFGLEVKSSHCMYSFPFHLQIYRNSALLPNPKTYKQTSPVEKSFRQYAIPASLTILAEICA